MTNEKFPLNQGEQIEIRRDAVMGAIEDVLAPKDPMQGEISKATDAKIDAALAQIQQELGVSEEEAEVILAERWTQQYKRQQGD